MKLKFRGNTLVRSFKQSVLESLGIQLRVYRDGASRRRVAPDGVTIASIVGPQEVVAREFDLTREATVEQAEATIAKAMGFTVEILDGTGYRFRRSKRALAMVPRWESTCDVYLESLGPEGPTLALRNLLTHLAGMKPPDSLDRLRGARILEGVSIAKAIDLAAILAQRGVAVVILDRDPKDAIIQPSTLGRGSVVLQLSPILVRTSPIATLRSAGPQPRAVAEAIAAATGLEPEDALRPGQPMLLDVPIDAFRRTLESLGATIDMPDPEVGSGSRAGCTFIPNGDGPCDVYLLHADRPIEAIGVIRGVTGAGLADAKSLVDTRGRRLVRSGLDADVAESLKRLLEKVGAAAFVVDRSRGHASGDAALDTEMTLVSSGARANDLVGLLAKVTGMELTECKAVVDAPGRPFHQCSRAEASVLRRLLEASGAAVELRPTDPRSESLIVAAEPDDDEPPAARPKHDLIVAAEPELDDTNAVDLIPTPASPPPSVPAKGIAAEAARVEPLSAPREQASLAVAFASSTDVTTPPKAPPTKKNRFAAAVLSILFGPLGAAKFYLGYTGWGFAYFATWLVCVVMMPETDAEWASASVLWGAVFYAQIILCLAEGLVYLTRSAESFERRYIVNRRPIL